MFPWTVFLDLRNYLKRLCINSVPKLLLEKIAEREGQISSLYLSGNTGNIYVLQSFLENITVLERGQFLPPVCIYICSIGGKIKKLKNQPIAWEVLMPVTTPLELEVIKQFE